MTFYLIGGISCTIAAVLCVVIYLVAHKQNEASTASKVIFWVGTLLGVAGASLLTIEFSFPSVSHPKKPTVADRFAAYYGDSYASYIEENVTHAPVDEYASVTHTKLKGWKEDEGNSHALFRTDVICLMSSECFSVSLLNDYEYDDSYAYQSVTTWRIENVSD